MSECSAEEHLAGVWLQPFQLGLQRLLFIGDSWRQHLLVQILYCLLRQIWLLLLLLLLAATQELLVYVLLCHRLHKTGTVSVARACQVAL